MEAGLAPTHVDIGGRLWKSVPVSHYCNQVKKGEYWPRYSRERFRKRKRSWKISRFFSLKYQICLISTNPIRALDFFVFPDVLEHIPVDQHSPPFPKIFKAFSLRNQIVIIIFAPAIWKLDIGEWTQKLQVTRPSAMGLGRSSSKALTVTGFYLDLKWKLYISIFFKEKSITSISLFRASKTRSSIHSKKQVEILIKNDNHQSNNTGSESRIYWGFRILTENSCCWFPYFWPWPMCRLALDTSPTIAIGTTLIQSIFFCLIVRKEPYTN